MSESSSISNSERAAPGRQVQVGFWLGCNLLIMRRHSGMIQVLKGRLPHLNKDTTSCSSHHALTRACHAADKWGRGGIWGCSSKGAGEVSLPREPCKCCALLKADFLGVTMSCK